MVSPHLRPLRSRSPRVLPPLLPLVLLFLLPGCELVLGPDGPRVSGVELVDQVELAGEAGEVLSTEAALRVVDASGDPIDGVELFFRVVEGGGSVSPTSAVSDAQGTVRLPAWTLGPVVGPQSLEAGVEGVATVLLTAQVRPAGPHEIEPAAEVAAEATVATSAGAPAVRVLDRFGNRIPGAQVRFVVTAGEGDVEATERATDEEGVAWAGSWVLGTRAGENRLEARVEGTSPLEFVVTGRPMDPAQAQGVSMANGGDGEGDGGEGDPEEEESPWEVPELRVGQRVPSAPTIRVMDPFGNGVPGVSVRFRVVAGEGYLSFPDQTTDSRGRAAPAYWQLGIRAGVQSIEAVVEGLDPVRFEAIALPGSPHGADYASLHHQHAPAGGQVPIRPAVRVWDVHGNPVPGVPVAFVITQGNGSLEGAEAVTNAEGVARVGAWTLASQPGENRLRATVGSFGPFTFIAVGDVGGPAQVLVHQGAGQSGPPNVALPTALAARVLDAVGNPVPDVEVHFAVTSGGARFWGTDPAPTARAWLWQGRGPWAAVWERRRWRPGSRVRLRRSSPPPPRRGPLQG